MASRSTASTRIETSTARRRRLIALAIGLALVALAALGTRAALDAPMAAATTTRDELCAQYEVLVDTLTAGSVFATQATTRAARKLSQYADRYAGQPRAEAAVTRAADDMRTVVGSIAWETPDLLAASRPIALECGWSWPVSSTPPAPVARPPTS